VTTYYIGQYAEKSGTTEKQYYYHGSNRIAMRSSSTLYFLLTDHPSSPSPRSGQALGTGLGSTSVTLSSTGAFSSEIR
jgi:hypothetical protein